MVNVSCACDECPLSLGVMCCLCAIGRKRGTRLASGKRKTKNAGGVGKNPKNDDQRNTTTQLSLKIQILLLLLLLTMMVLLTRRTCGASFPRAPSASAQAACCRRSSRSPRSPCPRPPPAAPSGGRGRRPGGRSSWFVCLGTGLFFVSRKDGKSNEQKRWARRRFYLFFPLRPEGRRRRESAQTEKWTHAAGTIETLRVQRQYR